jgi:lipopolysaccharide export system permease protein
MHVIQRYILRQLVGVAALVTLTLTTAIWLTQSLRFVELIVNRGLSLESYLYLTLLLLPSFLSLMLPIALFTAVLFTYNKLITDSELVVLRAVGLGPGRLARPAVALAIFVVGTGYVLSLWLLPFSYRQFKDLEFNVRSDYSSVLLKEGTFNNVSDGVTVYVRAREPDGELRGILMHDNRIREKATTLMAERGKLAMTEDGPRVILLNGNRQQVDRQDGKLALLYFERYSVDLGRVGQAHESRWREPRERYLQELLFPGDSADDRAYASRLRAEAHNRLTSPLLGLAFTLISLAAVLSGEFNRRGQSKRVLVAVGLAAALQTAAIGLGNAVVRWPVLAFLPYLLPCVVIVASTWWMLREPRRSPAALAGA